MSLINRISKFFKKNDRGTVSKEESIINVREYIGKYVKKTRETIGESIAVEKDRIIVKNSNTYLSIPLEKIKENAENIVVGDFDMEESLQLGKEWFERRDTLQFDKNGKMILNAPESQ